MRIDNPHGHSVAWMRDGTADRVPDDAVECPGVSACPSCAAMSSFRNTEEVGAANRFSPYSWGFRTRISSLRMLKGVGAVGSLTPVTVFRARVHNPFKSCEIVTPNAWPSTSRVGKQTFFFPRSMSEM